MLAERNQYVNLHAHREAMNANEWVLTNVNIDKFPEAGLNPGSFYSIGIHPWNLEKCNVKSALNDLHRALKKKNVIAIGEAGLDRSIDTSIDLQIDIFKAQLDIAEQAGVPVVIHSVKSSRELIQIMKEVKPTVAMIIHGYRGSLQQASDLVKSGFYLSFGHALQYSEKLRKVVKELPLQKLFIETDESDVLIEELYTRVSDLRGMTIEELRQHMLEKIDNLFL